MKSSISNIQLRKEPIMTNEINTSALKMGARFRHNATRRKYSYQGQEDGKVILDSFDPQTYPDILVSWDELRSEFQALVPVALELDE